EDGIRDFHVTGVQTCALPIFDDLVRAEVEVDAAAVQRDVLADTAEDVGQRLVALLADDVPERDVDRGQGERRDASRSVVADVARSEERRVGRGRRGRREPYD